jgi:hypothetical protein
VQIQIELFPNPRYKRIQFYIFRNNSIHDSSCQGWNDPKWLTFCKNGQIKVHQDNFHRKQFTKVCKRCIQDTSHIHANYVNIIYWLTSNQKKNPRKWNKTLGLSSDTSVIALAISAQLWNKYLIETWNQIKQRKSCAIMRIEVEATKTNAQTNHKLEYRPKWCSFKKV